MLVAYPKSLLSKNVDEDFLEEYLLIKEIFPTCMVDFQKIEQGETVSLPKSEEILYRGWMLSSSSYETLERSALLSQSRLMVSHQDYLASHHIKNWYDVIKPYTSCTLFGEENNIPPLPFDKCFVKDYVKSGPLSLCDEKDIPKAIAAIKHYKGFIEGGIAIREQEEYIGEEYRLFIINHKVFVPESQDIPIKAQDLAEEVSPLLPSPFYSIDLKKRNDGVWRVIEIGDGQVSDLKHWSLSDFKNMIKEGFGAPLRTPSWR